MLLAGLGIGALASQLGSVTVSAVPDEQSGEVGRVQNTDARNRTVTDPARQRMPARTEGPDGPNHG
jgi:hypothetical protein